MHLNDHAADLRLRRIRARARAGVGGALAAKVARNGTAAPPIAEQPVEDKNGDEHAAVERRRSARSVLDREVVVRRIGGFNFEVGIRDISVGGCRVEAIEEYEVGDPVITRFPKLEPLGSRVCWTNGKTAGIEFLRTLHPAVLDSLLERLA
jgi:PilZ domain